MFLAHSLWPVSNAGPPHKRVLEVLHHSLVDLVTEVLYSAVLAVQDHRLVEVRELAWDTQRWVQGVGCDYVPCVGLATLVLGWVNIFAPSTFQPRMVGVHLRRSVQHTRTLLTYSRFLV